ncbi:LacI family transcriptional regulator [Arthrobacter sp. CDRTa11]|uniref:LacI family DNA-binding transcriptional regulator n=1 Tax=Arthrobacter sp. CDRTa11 TaxID=2651199 RepID=UPI002265E8FA|nr:LacI family DNA-binding transcriptional regulator [Arthrobacter sp. CDRTa11]UZX02109.1 LacI family transcriptional regulator [Arthrobacter sp. CDRTa11]
MTLETGAAKAAKSGRPATIYDVAETAGVSTQTVTRFLNGFEGISQATRTKVGQAIEELGFRPNPLARALRTSKPNRILLFVHELSEAGPSNIVRAATKAAAAAGYVLDIVSLDVDSLESSARTIKQTGLQYVAGAMSLAPTAEFDALFDDLARRVPLLREVNGDGLEGPQAQSDTDLGTQLAVRHLHDLGHRGIFIIAGPEGWFSTTKRLRTAITETAALGMAITGVQHGDWSAASAFAIARDASFDDRTTAIIAANDEMAMGALAALDQRGMDVPGDLSIVGFDDVRGAAYFKPALTTVHIDFKAKGDLAVSRLLALIAGQGEESVEVPGAAMVPPRLVVRASTAPVS